MIRFPQNMVGKQRKNNRPDFTSFDPLNARTLEIPEFPGQCKCVVPAQNLIICRSGSLQQALVICGKVVGGVDEFIFAGIQQPPNKQRMFHHYLIPEQLTVTKFLIAAIAQTFQPHQISPVETSLPKDMLDEQRIIYGEQITGLDAAQDPFLII